MPSSGPVLVIEDDLIDAMTVQRALRQLGVGNKLVRVADSEEALVYLRNAGAERPCVVLLDLNAPKMNGVEFLRIAKSDAVLRDLPVVIMTGSNEQRDIYQTMSLGAAGYIVKSVNYGEFVDSLRTIEQYWNAGELSVKG